MYKYRGTNLVEFVIAKITHDALKQNFIFFQCACKWYIINTFLFCIMQDLQNYMKLTYKEKKEKSCFKVQKIMSRETPQRQTQNKHCYPCYGDKLKNRVQLWKAH